MRSSLISYPTEHFSKLIYVREILFHRPYEAYENSNTVRKNCLVNHDRLKRHILCLELKTVEKIRCPRKRFFKVARDESYLQLVYLEEKIEGRTI